MNSFEEDKKRIEKYKVDAFMREVACFLAEEDLKEFEAAVEDESSVVFTQDFDKRMEKTLRTFQRNDRKRKRKVIYREMTRIAVIALVCVGVASIALSSTANAFKMKFQELVWRDSGDYYEIQTMPKTQLSAEATALFPAEWPYVFYPEEIPTGYELASVKEENNMRFLRFENGDGHRIDFSYIAEDQAFTRIEKQDNVLRETAVGGKPGLCIENPKTERTILIWNQSGFQFKLLTTLDSTTTAKMAESVSIVNLHGEETVQIADGEMTSCQK